MNTTQKENTYRFGLKGQDWLEGKLIDYGYMLYKKNIKQIGLELDLVMYKHIKDKNIVLIHIIEVKTRRVVGHSVDLESFNLRRKWQKVRQIMFDIPEEVRGILKNTEVRTAITFDLAVVLDKGNGFSLHKYIQNVNLLL